MSQVAVLFGIFSKVFRIFGFWPASHWSNVQKAAAAAAFLFFILIFGILMGLSLLNATSIEEYVTSIFYIMGYVYTFSSIAVLWLHRPQLETLMSKMLDYFNEDQLAFRFVSSAATKAKLLTTVVMTWTTLVLNFGVVIVPAFLSSLTIPMWIPGYFDKDWTFGLFWIYQIFSVNYTLANVAIFVYMCVLLMHINGYAECLGCKLKEFNGEREQLVQCIQTQRKLRELISDFSSVFGTIHGLFLKLMECLVASCMFAIFQNQNATKFDSILMFGGYILSLETLILIPCYLGAKLSSTSEQYVDDLLASGWIVADLNCKKLLLTFMEDLKHPVTLNVLLHRNLNLVKFTENLNAAYSLFSVLRNVRNPKY